MQIDMTEKKEPRVIKANYVLQAKVGSGPLDEKAVEECQRVMDEADVDFAPMANEFLNKLENAVKQVRSGELTGPDAKQAMTQPVMELKANASTFKYDLIGNLANIMLSFLETVNKLDKTVIEIVDVHHKTLKAIIANKMKGDGGASGKALEQELKDACKRYFQAKSS